MKTVASPDVTVEQAVEQIDIGKSAKPYLKTDRGRLLTFYLLIFVTIYIFFKDTIYLRESLCAQGEDKQDSTLSPDPDVELDLTTLSS